MSDSFSNPITRLFNHLFSRPNSQATTHAHDDAPETIATINHEAHSYSQNNILYDIIKQVPECQSIACVDINQRILLNKIALPDTAPNNVCQQIVAFASDLFTTPNAMKLSSLYPEIVSTEHRHLNEIIMHGDDHVYVFIRSTVHRDRVGVFACHSAMPTGVMLIHARQLMLQIESMPMA